MSEDENWDANQEVAEKIIKEIYFGYGSWCGDEFEIVVMWLEKMFEEHPEWDENDLKEILLTVSKTFPPEEWDGRIVTEGIIGGGTGVYHRGPSPDSYKNYGDRSPWEALQSDRSKENPDHGNSGTYSDGEP